MNDKLVKLVDAMDRAFDFATDTNQLQEYIKRLQEDTIRLEPIITAMLKRVSECAIFVCEYLRPSFVGMFRHSSPGFLEAI